MKSQGLLQRLLAKKSVDQILAESDTGEKGLKKILNVWDLISIGLGCIIGTGIFVLTGEVAIRYAGPGIILSFLICAVACVFAALCYAEFASLLPIAGSAYTFSYASLGEFTAWLIGWCLVLQYGVSASAVAVGWTGYSANFLETTFHLRIPEKLLKSPVEGGYLNLPALLIILVLTWFLVKGIRESAWVNNLIVVLKVGVSIFIIVFGLFFVNPSYWSPLVPKFIESAGASMQNLLKLPFNQLLEVELYKIIGSLANINFQQGFGGIGGILLGASIIFFAYIGFDAVSTTAEEAKNPGRDLPIGIVGSLVICTILYIMMSLVFTGIVKTDGTLTIDQLGADRSAPMAYMFNQLGITWASQLISIGAIAAMTSVMLVTLLGQTRIFFAMARDGLLPPFVATIHPKYRTPHVVTIIAGSVFAIMAGFIPLEHIAALASIGTLAIFVVVSIGIIVLRKYQPERKATFRTPLVPWIPLLSVFFSLAIMFSCPLVTWIGFIGWILVGIIIYALYGYRSSKLAKREESTEIAA